MTNNDPGGRRARALVEDYVAGLSDDEFTALQQRTRLPAVDPKERAAAALASFHRGLRVNVDAAFRENVDKQRAPGNPLDGLHNGGGTGLGTPIATTTTAADAAKERAADALRRNVRPGQTRD